ncbi:MAG: hypothetical protein R2877_07950 [Bdellovibrionota bacterium]
MEISASQKKILILRKKTQPIQGHCFENMARLDLFHDTNPSDWLAFLLLQDGHQVYAIDPDNMHMLDQWAHEYGLTSGSHNLNKILNSKIVFKIVSEILFKVPWLMRMGRKILFWIGKLQKKSDTSSTLRQFMVWFQPDITISEQNLRFKSVPGDSSFSHGNLTSLMDDPQFKTSMESLFKAARSQLN